MARNSSRATRDAGGQQRDDQGRAIAGLLGDDAHQPDRRRQQRQPEQPSQGQHPTPGPRQVAAQARQRREQQIRCGETQPQAQEDRENIHSVATKPEADRGAEKRRGARRRHHRCQHARGETAGDRMRGLPPGRQPAGEQSGRRDFEQTEEIGGEGGGRGGERRQEHRLLKLDAPAHRHPRLLAGGQQCGEREKGGHNPRCTGEKAGAPMPGSGIGQPNDGQNLDRQNRQHARHEIQDEPAEQRGQDDGEVQGLGRRRP
jgi:hypothetical protein